MSACLVSADHGARLGICDIGSSGLGAKRGTLCHGDGGRPTKAWADGHSEDSAFASDSGVRCTEATRKGLKTFCHGRPGGALHPDDSGAGQTAIDSLAGAAPRSRSSTACAPVAELEGTDGEWRWIQRERAA